MPGVPSMATISTGMKTTMSDQPASLAAALVQLQAALPRIVKDDRAQAGNRVTSYANLNTITDAVFPILAGHGFAWICRPTLAIEKFVLHYQLLHAPSGEAIEGEYPLPASNPQTMGGAITYARRYALCAVLGIAPAEDDDDAERASRAAEARQNARTHQIQQESAASPPPHARPAERSRGRLPDDQWTREPAVEAP